MAKCITKTEADKLFQKEHDYKEEYEFWNKFSSVEFTEADIKDKELHFIMWHNTDNASPSNGKKVLIRVRWYNGKVGIYLGKKVSESDWVYDYDDKKLYPADGTQGGEGCGNVTHWSYIERMN